MRFRTDAPPARLVDTPEALEAAVRECSEPEGYLGVDTETLMGLGKVEWGNMTDYPLWMGLSPSESSRILVGTQNIKHFRSILEDRGIRKTLHNYKFDAHRFANLGINLNGHIFDTLMADFLHDEDTRENRHSLDQCARDYFGLAMGKYGELFGKEDPRAIKPGHPLWQKFQDYSTFDPWVGRKLAGHLEGELRKQTLWKGRDDTLLDHYWGTEWPQLQALFEMERRGIKVDEEALERIEKSLSEEMDEKARQVSSEAGYPLNPNSAQQMAQYLFDELGHTPLGRTPTGRAKCDEAVLKHFAGKGVDVCSTVLEFRKASKLRGTYAIGLRQWIGRDGRIHTTYSPIKLTGRLGSADPNLQNIPRPDNDPHGLRAAFIPDDENCVLIVVDYAQLEMRIMADACADEKMIGAILQGLDMHSFTAAMMMGIEYEVFLAMKKAGDTAALMMRQGAKNVGFGIIYGITSIGLAAQLTQKLKRVVTKEEAQGYLDMYLNIYPGVRRYMESMIAQARDVGYVQTICGRFRRLSKINSRNWRDRGHAENQAINAPIQGSAADIVKKSMIVTNFDAYLREQLGCTLRMQIHDELVFNCPKENAAEAAEIISWYMEHPFTRPLAVPLPAEPAIVPNWGAAKG